MRPVREIPIHDLENIQGILFDIDDTFTLNGRIIPQAYSALWKLHDTGLFLVPITGRPAGWCDHIARMWPVDAVVGENGAFYYFYCKEEGRLKRRYVIDPEEMQRRSEEMEKIRQEVSIRVPDARIAADQHFRLFDLAVDFAEDVPRLSRESIRDICRVFEEHHAVCKVSSIHVNGWFGDYDKRTTARLFLEERLNISWQDAQETVLYMGDSPNDEPMFEAFPFSVGVANVKRFVDSMDHPPAYITEQEGGLGFAEMAQAIISSRP